ncbi:hypothetical protein SNOG_14331 [Parastagonospora nodorum SN15]|uniref:Uncharacterized protein n=1 Tax=Phaeosphaeria nodorum (strain SN15 / ATCC MYA-4574 / FGSC 10173) TaxID=321614 RepID=Q0U1F1_PHANO|nr:hypothetical protein SNOG_14331 [Parastagonospora nodorum SN15]EAT78202.1 hypothetical protein SNOG_14331 [Parastagonospora nodorum SN15]
MVADISVRKKVDLLQVCNRAGVFTAIWADTAQPDAPQTPAKFPRLPNLTF